MSSQTEDKANDDDETNDNGEPLPKKTCVADTEEDEENPSPSVSASYAHLLSRHALDALYKQAMFRKRIVRGRSWKISLDPTLPHSGQLGFYGDDDDDESKTDYCPCQILGTESDASGTWLWGNANSSVQQPDETCRVTQLRQEQSHLKEFVNDQMSLQQVQGHELAMIATGLLDLPAYFVGRNGTAGRVFYLVTDVPSQHSSSYLGNKVDVGELVLAVGRASETMDLVPLTPERIESFLLRHGATAATTPAPPGSTKPKHRGGTDKHYRFDAAKATEGPPGCNEVIVSLDDEGDVTNIRTAEADPEEDSK